MKNSSMAKDPAFLFYYVDFLHGTRHMTREQKGLYIELICEQADSISGSIPADIYEALTDCECSGPVKKKFDLDAGGYYNPRLRETMEKRKNFTESRRKNLQSKKKDDVDPDKDHHMDPHKDAHMGNRNRNRNLDKRNESFKASMDPYRAKYPREMLNEFYMYWTEPNKSQSKMRWELEPTWSISRRLGRWFTNYQEKHPVSKGTNLGGKPIPKDYGEPSPTATPMPESIKKRLLKIGKP